MVIDDLKPGKDMADRAGVDFIAAGWTHTVPHIIETMQRICPHYCRTVAELAVRCCWTKRRHERWILG